MIIYRLMLVNNKNHLVLSVLMLSLLAQIPTITQYANAQGVDVGVGAEIDAGKDNSTVSSETKAEGSADVESYDNENTADESAAAEEKTNIAMSYPKVSASSESEVVIQPRHMLYQPGDTITVEGSLWGALMSQLGQSGAVKIQVLDGEGNVVNENTVKVNSDGNYDAQISIPPNSVGGKYTVKSELVADSSVLAVLGLANTDLESSSDIVVSVPTMVTVSAEGHGDFDVGIASSSDVSQVKFNAQEKTLAFQVTGETGTHGVTQITIPKQLLSGQITVLIDGHVMASDGVIMTADTDAKTTLELNYSHSTHTIDIVGTNAVPEFGPISVLVLIVAIAVVLIAGMNKTVFTRLR